MTDLPDTEPDTELRAMARQLFADDRQEPDIDLGQPRSKGTNAVPAEGDNPDAGPIDAAAYERDFTRRMFDPDYAAYQQELPQ